MTFSERLQERILSRETRLCLGLDPRTGAHESLEKWRTHTLEVLEACAPFVACAKPQLAFFEAAGLFGMQALLDVTRLCREMELPVILDAKRGDIGSTAAAYAGAWLAGEHAGSALTVNPFLGFETLTPFVDTARTEGGAVFVLVKTSNPGHADLQGRGVSEAVAAEVTRLGAEEVGLSGGLSGVGAVVGATHPEELEGWRRRLPHAWLLLPGLGAQGARPEDLAGAFLPGGLGAVVSASRAVQYPQGERTQAPVGESREAARELARALNAVVG